MKDDAFDETSVIGARGVRKVMDILSAGGLRCHLIGEKRLSIADEVLLGDVLVRGRTYRTLEVKNELKHTGNLFLETWSHRRARRPGWMETGDFDLIAFSFESNEHVYIYDFGELKRWAHAPALSPFARSCDCVTHGRLCDFEWQEMTKYKGRQSNDTWGHLVPLATKGLPPRTQFNSERRTKPQMGLFGGNGPICL